jgi:hypothetical protein
MNEKELPGKKRTEEIDIADFFRFIGRGFSSIGQGIKWLFVSLYDLLIDLFLFIKRKMAWLIPGLLLGLGFGIYSSLTGGPSYITTMTVKSNTGNTYFLYNQVDYLNSLIHNQRFADLSKECNLSVEESKSLQAFKIEPVKNEIEEALLYRDIFYRYKRNHYIGYDTSWSKIIMFKDFQETLTNLDYPLQQITLLSRRPDIYPAVQQAFVNSINNVPQLKQKQLAEIELAKQDEMLLADALKNLDTLRQVYNKKLELEASQPAGGSNQFVLGDRNTRSPELDLYDKSLMIKDELIEVRKKIADQAEPLQLISGFSKVGTRTSSIRQPLKYALFGFALTFVVLVLIEFFRYLTWVEKNSRAMKSKKLSNSQ